MRLPSIAFLLLAMSLPAIAHHDRHAHDYRRAWRQSPRMLEECGPRFIRDRPPTPPWARRPRVILWESRPWCDDERYVVLAPPPPPVLVRPSMRLWIGF